MDNAFLDLYEEELRFLRDMGREFAQTHPKIASRLDLDTLDTPDPYTERLLEGFAFLTARVRMRMEAEFPAFTQGLLGLLYPNFIAPTPAAAIFELTPDFREGALTDGFTIHSGASMIARPEGRDTACEFVTKSDVTLRPLVIDHAEYTDQPTVVNRMMPGQKNVEAIIRLRIRLAADAPIESLKLDPLTLYIDGEGSQPDEILQALVSSAVKITAIPHDPDAVPNMSKLVKLSQGGFEETEALIPQSATTFSGHRLLQEAFIMPEKFRFVSLTGLEKALVGADTRSFEIIFGLSQSDDRLIASVRKQAFKLHCVTAINLFERRADRVSVSAGEHEHLVTVDRTRPRDFEVYDVLTIDGVTQDNNTRHHFEPIFAPDSSGDTKRRHGYFSMRRESQLVSSKTREGAYLGANVYVRLSGKERGPAPGDIDQLIVKTLCTNRGLPNLLTSKSRYTLQSAGPVKDITPVVRPTATRPPLARDAASWELINALSLNHLSFASSSVNNAAWLTRLLSLFADSQNEVHRQIVQAYNGLDVKLINRRLPGDGPISYARGLEMTLSAETDALRGTGPFLFASVLERFFARAASINSFTQTVLSTPGYAETARWPARAGARHSV